MIDENKLCECCGKAWSVGCRYHRTKVVEEVLGVCLSCLYRSEKSFAHTLRITRKRGPNHKVKKQPPDLTAGEFNRSE